MIKMSNKINSNRTGLFFIAVLALLMFSCANNQYLQSSCTLPSGVNLEEALTHSRDELGRLECERMFDSYYERLIDVAKRDPDRENRRRFSDFLMWANEEGIIDKIQARNYYNRYFNTTFMSLQDDFNVCSSCPEDAKRELEVELQNELGQKEDGLLRACQDKQAYYAAADQYNSILLLLDATCTACRNN
jgi:hypothetical protein